MTADPDCPKVYGLDSNLKANTPNSESESVPHGHAIDTDHLALIYEEQEEQFATIVPFLRHGLEQNERCLYVADDNTKEDVLEALRESGIDVENARNTGALTIHDKDDTYLRAGEFDRDAMIEFWRETLEEAKTQHEFDGIRAAAEMTWALESGTDLDDLLKYEELLNTLYSGKDYTVVCQYNRNRFPPYVISDVVETHPLLVHENTVCRNTTIHPEDDPTGTDKSQLNDFQTPQDPRVLEPSLPSVFQERNSQSTRVLHVDDETEFLKLAATYLEREEEIDTVVTETSPREALRRLDKDRFDCVISDYEMPDVDGLEFLNQIREKHPNLPFILFSGKGNEEIASEAISAGVTDYLQKKLETNQYTTLAHRISTVVDKYHAEQEVKRTQERYRRLIEESTDVIAILNQEGEFTYLSPAAERRLGYHASELIGDDGFEYTHPADEESVLEAFTSVLKSPSNRASVEFRFQQRDGSWIWLEARARNLLDTPAIEGVVVYARDVTERKKREQALRESEQRFRSLFEKAFDAIVLTNDDGECVEVNPAACELLGLSREELLGVSLTEFVPEEYDFEEMWQVVQQTEQDLETVPLVCADDTRHVVEFASTTDIVPGRHLSVLHDVTDREQYEQTLTSLHHSSHELLDAESREAVAEIMVETATDLLSMSAATVFLFDSTHGTLSLAAANEAIPIEKIPTPLTPAQNSIMGSVFLDKEPKVIEEISGTEYSAWAELPVCGCLFLPIGDHGVCIVGATDVGVTAEDRELTELLVAAGETSLDRITKEQKLRDRETNLQARNRTLEQLNQLNTVVRDVDETLVQAETREEIEQAVSTKLHAVDGIAFAWFSEYDTVDEQLIPKEWAGAPNTAQYLDSVSLHLDGNSSEPTIQSALAGDVVYIGNVTDDLHKENWRKAALSAGFRSAISIPLTYKQYPYGTITVYAEHTHFLDELSRSVLEELGNNIASAINSIEHQNAVLAETSTELTFRITDENAPMYYLASEAACSLRFQGITPESDGKSVVRIEAEGASIDTITAIADNMTDIAEIAVVSDNGDKCLLECFLWEKPPLSYLADRAVRIREFTADHESATLSLDVPDPVDSRWVRELIREKYSDVKLVAKRKLTHNDAAPEEGVEEAFRSKLTPRQQEVLQTAYRSGFFRSPRECTGEALADQLDVSPQTVYSHLRTAERKLFETVFEEG